MWSFIKDVFTDIVGPILIALLGLAIVVAIIRGVMFLVSHVWLSVSTGMSL